jgi:hypothetical protein
MARPGHAAPEGAEMRETNSERGTALIMVALMLTVLVSFLALLVDLGMGYIERRRIQGVADAASLAGVQVLVNNLGNDAILDRVHEYAIDLNQPAGNETRVDPPEVRWIGGPQDGQLVARGGNPQPGVTGIQVTVTGSTPTFFANVLGITQVTSSASGSGGYSPLDLVLVLDQSTSMMYDSVCDFASYFSWGRPCDGINGGDPLGGAYCDDCRGVWRRPSIFSPYACYWPDNTLMSSVPAKCVAAGGVGTQARCEACKGNAEPWLPITTAKDAAVYFVSLVYDQLAPTSPRLGLVTYSTRACQPTGNPNHPCLGLTLNLLGEVLPKINSIQMVPADPMYFTNCEEGMSVARGYLNSTGRTTAVKAIVFLTDGQANRCIGGGTCSNAKQRAINQAHTAQNERIRVYTIGLGVDADRDMLQQMADDPDGDFDGAYVYARTASELVDKYDELFAMIKQLRLVQ